MPWLLLNIPYEGNSTCRWDVGGGFGVLPPRADGTASAPSLRRHADVNGTLAEPCTLLMWTRLYSTDNRGHEVRERPFCRLSKRVQVLSP